MNRRHLFLAVWIGAIVLLSSPTYNPTLSTATIVWADDFNDGNYDGWMVYGLNWTLRFATPAEGNFSAADNTLRATGAEWSYADHPSSVAWGTWSFDVFATETPDPNVIHVHFMINDWDSYPDNIYSYSITILPHSGSFKLIKWAGRTLDSDENIDTYYVFHSFSGWQHIDVTRDADGQFYVYINGTLRMEAVDTEITTSTNFRFASQTGPALDNIIVSNTVDITPPIETTTTTTAEIVTTTPETTSTPVVGEWLTIGIGVPVVIVMIGAVWKWKLRKRA